MQEMLTKSLTAPRQRRARSPIQVDTSKQLGAARKDVPRILSANASRGLLRVGLKRRWWDDLYHRALTLSWPQFLLAAATVYLGANCFFALLYLAQPGSVTNARPGSFLDAFFFSVETFGTIGYGVLAPATTYANTVMTGETLTGILLVALTTGIIFARVSRPTARVLFSKVAVVAPYDGQPTLMVRMANERQSQILQADVTMTLIRNELNREGLFMRRFYDLRLARDRTPIFAMSFQAMHPINEKSPLYGVTPETLREQQAEILVSVSGLDETMAQLVHARASYVVDDIKFSHRYADIFGITNDGRRAIDYGRFHLAEPL